METSFTEQTTIIKTPHYGGFWIRALAYFIDGIINNVIGIAIGIFLGIFIGMGVNAASIEMTEFNEMLLRIISFILSLITTWLYFALFQSSKYMATPGKMIFGLIVVDKEYKRLSFAHATGRFFATLVSTITFLIGFIMAAFTNKKRALHDMIAGTYVIYK
jgi:uncharacterized RDD family membrane protein YckC